MGEDYWAPVFARLLEDIDFLRNLCCDTSDADLVNWVLPNRPLAQKCARFIRRHKITDRASLISEVIDFAEEDEALRKIILFTWVEKNPKTMGFMSIPANQENIARLIAGHFGKPAKIKILGRIDPRTGAEKIYQHYFNEHPEVAIEEAAAHAAELAAPDLEKRLQETTEMATRAVKRSRELEAANEKIKSDNRQLKKDLESREKEVPVLNRRLEESVTLLKAAEAKIEDLERQICGLKLQIKSSEVLKPSPQAATATDVQESEKFKEACEDQQKQIDGLQKALQNRDNSILRLENEKVELQRQIRNDDDQQRRVENLQASLRTLEGENMVQARLAAGQLVTRLKTAGKPGEWLFVSVTGQTFNLSAAIVKSAGVISEEFSLLQLDAAGEPVKLTSLEAENRKEILGYLKAESDGLWLLSDSEEKLPVCINVDAHFLEKPVRGFYLGEAGQREAGIYHVENLKTADQKNFEVLTASTRQLKTFFNADMIDFDHFCRELGKLKVSFKLDKENQLKFSRDYRQVLNGLRSSLPVSSYCSTPACLERARMAIMARVCQQGQACSFCGGFPTEKDSPGNFQFNGERILIFGGDRIGSEYERVLARHNLLVKWHSGFQNLQDLRNGLGKVDAVVIVVRQISHTLLREISPLAEKEKIPLIYSTRRGTSGVLSHLLDFFNGQKE